MLNFNKKNVLKCINTRFFKLLKESDSSDLKIPIVWWPENSPGLLQYFFWIIYAILQNKRRKMKKIKKISLWERLLNNQKSSETKWERNLPTSKYFTTKRMAAERERRQDRGGKSKGWRVMFFYSFIEHYHFFIIKPTKYFQSVFMLLLSFLQSRKYKLKKETGKQLFFKEFRNS